MEKQNSLGGGCGISSRQLIAVTFILGLGLNMLNLPAVAIMEGGRDGWLSMVFITVIDCAMLYLTLLLMQKMRVENPKAAACLKIIFGVVGLVWTMAKLVLLFGEMRLFYGETVFENLNWTVFLALIGALAAILGASKARSLGRLCELALPIVLTTSVLLVFTSFVGDVDYSDVLPMLYKNPAAIKSPWRLAMWTGNYPVLLGMFSKVEFKRGTKLFCVGAAAVSGMIATVITFALSAAYGSIRDLISYGSNASDMNQYVGGYNFGRIDLIIFTVWSVTLIIECGIYQFTAVRCFSAVIGIDKPKLYSFILAAAVYLVMNFGIDCKFKLFEFAYRFASPFAAAVQFVLPPIVAAVFGVVTAVKHSKNKQGGKGNEKQAQTADI